MTDCNFLYWSCEDFVKTFTLEIFVIAVLTIAGVFHKRIAKFIGKYYLLFTDKQAGIIITYTQKYNEPPTKVLDVDIFDELKNQLRNTDKITKVAVNPNFLRIKSDKLGMTLDIAIIEEPKLDTLSMDTPYVNSYSVVIKMDAEIRGVRHIDRVQDFINTALTIHHIIQLRCFKDQEIQQSFAVCDIVKLLGKPRNQNIEDDDLKARIAYIDHDLAITSKEPQNLSKTVKKYVYA